MARIGLAVVTYLDNYGSELQTYATQKIIQDMGIEAKIFDIEGVHKKIKVRKIVFYLRRLSEPDEFKYLFQNLVNLRKLSKKNGSYSEHMKQRHQKYEEFNKKYLRFFERKNNWKALTDQSKECDAVLVGSDQLWRPSNIVGGFFTLEFVPDYINKIAYATSFGVSVLPKYQNRKAKKFLNRIQYISVRENAGKKLIKNLTRREVPVVCDPTMLLNADEWMEIQESEPIIEGNYILCYFLGDNILHRNFANGLKKILGYKVVAPSGGVYIAGDENFGDIIPYDVGPCEFVNLIRNAAYVCTDSFHGTVFSILNERKFFTFKRFKDSSEFSTNDRIETLLGWTGLMERMITGEEDPKDMVSREIDYPIVLEKVEKKRKESKRFLEDALKASLKGA